MMARSRPNPLLPFVCLVVFVALTSTTVLTVEQAHAKTRPEVQAGDPTDTDPGPTPGPTKVASRFVAVYDYDDSSSHNYVWLVLKQWVHAILLAYR